MLVYFLNFFDPSKIERATVFPPFFVQESQIKCQEIQLECQKIIRTEVWGIQNQSQAEIFRSFPQDSLSVLPYQWVPNFYNFQNGSMRLFHHSKGFCSVLGQRFYKISTKFLQNVHQKMINQILCVFWGVSPAFHCFLVFQHIFGLKWAKLEHYN